MPTSMIHVRVDDDLKVEASETLAAVGLTVSDAIRILFRRVVADRAFPLELKSPDRGSPGAVRATRASFAAPTARPAIEELDLVRLRAQASTEDGVLPLGALGTVVHRYRDGAAYEVEFSEPVAAVLTLRPDEIEPTPG